MNNPYNQHPGQPPQGYPPQGQPPGYAPPGYAPPGQPAPGYAPPGYAPPGYAQPGYAQPSYEFSAVENQTIGRASTWAKAVAIFFFIQAAVELININVVGIAIDLGIGIALWKGGKSLQGVVDTQGNDVPQMMEALEQLSQAFTIRLVIVAIAVGLIAIVGVIAGLFAASL